MAETKTFVANTPVWVDLSSTDAAGSRDYYAKLFGWKVELAPEPDAGGYALALDYRGDVLTFDYSTRVSHGASAGFGKSF